MASKTYTLEQIAVAKTQKPGLWLVLVNGVIVGQLEKFKDTRSTTHPWKAYSGNGMTRASIGVFYGKNGPCLPPGGKVQKVADPKTTAINAILDAHAKS